MGEGLALVDEGKSGETHKLELGSSELQLQVRMLHSVWSSRLAVNSLVY